VTSVIQGGKRQNTSSKTGIIIEKKGEGIKETRSWHEHENKKPRKIGGPKRAVLSCTEERSKKKGGGHLGEKGPRRGRGGTSAPWDRGRATTLCGSETPDDDSSLSARRKRQGKENTVQKPGKGCKGGGRSDDPYNSRVVWPCPFLYIRDIAKKKKKSEKSRETFPRKTKKERGATATKVKGTYLGTGPKVKLWEGPIQ